MGHDWEVPPLDKVNSPTPVIAYIFYDSVRFHCLWNLIYRAIQRSCFHSWGCYSFSGAGPRFCASSALGRPLHCSTTQICCGGRSKARGAAVDSHLIRAGCGIRPIMWGISTHGELSIGPSAFSRDLNSVRREVFWPTCVKGITSMRVIVRRNKKTFISIYPGHGEVCDGKFFI